MAITILSIILIGCGGDSGGGGGNNNSGGPRGGGDPPAPVPVRKVSTHSVAWLSTGDAHGCAVNRNGNVFCWGRGDSGQLGNDGTADTNKPVAVVDGDSSTTPLGGIIQVAAGAKHSCALTGTGGVLCWGINSSGELGNGDSTVNETDHPVEVVDGDGNPIKGIIQIDSMGSHTCALNESGSIFCWGDNVHGQLGNNTNTNSHHAVAVAAGEDSTTPLNGIVQLSTGNYATCALTSEEKVLCWGDSAKQLPGGTSTHTDYPVELLEAVNTPLNGIVQVSAGHYNICVLTSQGQVKCLGYNDYGELGTGSTGSRTTYMVDVIAGRGQSAPLGDIAEVTTGKEQVCALTNSGEVLCWGDNSRGQLGDNSVTERHSPVAVVSDNSGESLLKNIIEVRAGTNYMCALSDSGSIYCWGFGSKGRLGNGGTDDKNHPTVVLDPDDDHAPLDIGARNTEYSCYDNSTCRFEKPSLITVTPVNGESGWSATPNVLVNNVEAGQTVSLHLDASCLSDPIGSGTVADAETSITITPTVPMPSLRNYLYAKVESDCAPNRGYYTRFGAITQLFGVERENALIIGIRNLTVGDTVSLHLSEDCSDESLFSATAKQVEIYNLRIPFEPKLRTYKIYLQKNGVCYPNTFEHEYRIYQGRYSKVSGGNNHTCAVDVRGGVRCWGVNGSGQLGNDSTTNTNDPAIVVDGNGSSSPLLGVVQVAAGGGHTCALMKKNGGVKCWGAGVRGKLGDGGNANKDHPVDVVGVGGTGTLTDIVQLDAGDNHTCAVTGEGGVVCWGIGDNGRLGNNAATDSASPVVVLEDSAPLTGIVQVSVGIEHACALTNEKGIKCWGKGQNGQFGNGSNPGTQKTAVSTLVSSTDQSPLTRAIQISVGGYRTCALMSNNQIKCWGTDTHGELGNVGTGQQTYPVDVTNSGGTPISGILSVSVGREHTCALHTGGGVKCWGKGDTGQVGNGDDSNQEHPVNVAEREVFAALASAEGKHQCALTREGEVMCWGFNYYGQLGDDTNAKKHVPVAVVADHGETHSLGIGNWQREYVCYGDGSCGFDRDTFAVPKLSDPSGGNTHGTDSTPSFTIDNLKSFESISLHPDIACAGDPLASGRVDNGATSLTLTGSALSTIKNTFFIKKGDICRPHRTDYTYEDGANRITGVLLSDDHTPTLTVNLLAIGDDFSLHRQSDCSDSALVEATATATSEEVTLTGELSHGKNTLYVKQEGICYPRGDDYDVATYTGDLPRISEGGSHTCALTSSGGVKCWGWGGKGQLGNDGTSNTDAPVDVVSTDGSSTPLANIIQISSGLEHTCALTASGGVKCWGRAALGRLGNNDSTNNKDAPVDVVSVNDVNTALSGIVQISGQLDHTCALTSEGGVVCWGKNDNGRLGNDCNSSCSNSAQPVTVVAANGSTAPLANIVQVSAGGHHTCALTANNTVKCWGWGARGQLGNGGTTVSVDAPTNITNISRSSILFDNVTQINTGHEHTCAVTSTGNVACWGEEYYGRLGNKATDDETGPVFVHTSSTSASSLGGIVQVAAAGGHTCALTSGGGVKCWGRGAEGRLGDNCFEGTCVKSDTAIDVHAADGNTNALSGIAKLGNGSNHTCAVTTSNEVKCWGAGGNGRLGNDATSNRDYPASVVQGNGKTAKLRQCMKAASPQA